MRKIYMPTNLPLYRQIVDISTFYNLTIEKLILSRRTGRVDRLEAAFLVSYYLIWKCFPIYICQKFFVQKILQEIEINNWNFK